MKIAFDAKRIFHNFRGLGNYSRTLVEGLSEFYPENKYSLYTPPLIDRRGFEWIDQFGDIDLISPVGWSSFFPSVWRRILLSNVLKKKLPDIYHGLSHELPVGIEKTGIKTVVTVHDLIFIRYPEFFPWIDRVVYKRKIAHSCKVSDMVIAICEQTKQDIIEFLGIGEEKIRVVYQSCNPIFYNLLNPLEKNHIRTRYKLPDKYLLYVGVIEERKNAQGIVGAFSKLRGHDEVFLVLVGNGKEYKEKVIAGIRKEGIEDRVIFLNDIPTPHLPAIYQCAIAFVWPSFFEGWGIPLTEALFSGIPVITSKGSCFPESAGPDSIYVDPYNIDELKDAILELLSDSEKRERMAKVGQEYVKKFHWENTTNRLMDVYRELLSL